MENNSETMITNGTTQVPTETTVKNSDYDTTRRKRLLAYLRGLQDINENKTEVK